MSGESSADDDPTDCKIVKKLREKMQAKKADFTACTPSGAHMTRCALPWFY